MAFSFHFLRGVSKLAEVRLLSADVFTANTAIYSMRSAWTAGKGIEENTLTILYGAFPVGIFAVGSRHSV